jgi:PAS domain S-box-containing protein
MNKGSGKEPETAPKDPDRGTVAGNDQNSVYAGLFRDLTMVLGLLAVLTALLGFIGMRFDITLISTVYPGYRTMALSAVLIWTIIGFVLIIHAAKPLPGMAALVVRLILAAIIIVEAIELPLNILGTHSLFELWLTEAGKTIIGPSSAPMSPVATVFIILAALSLFFLLQDPQGTRKVGRVADAAGITGLVIAVVSFTFVLSYAFGDPLLYGTQYIPIAAMSALAAIFTGAGLMTIAGPAAVPLKYITGNSTEARLLRYFVPLVVIIILVQQVLFSMLSAYHLIDDAILVAGILVLFALATGYVVSRISGSLGSALDRAERELVHKNEDLGAMNEELGAMNEELVSIEEELRQNIDELGKSQEALRESEGRLSLAQQAAGAGIWDWNVVTGAITWSPYLYELFGIDKEKPPASFDIWNRILHPDDREGANMRIRRALDQHGTLDSEYRIVRPDGKVRWINALGQGSFNDQGRPVGMSGICIDITDRKKIEHDHSVLETRYRRLYETAKDGVLIIDADSGKIFDANPFILDLLGYQLEDLAGRELWEIGFIQDETLARDAFRELRDKGYIRYEDLPVKTKDGRSIDVEFVSNSYMVDHTRIIQCNIRDITARKKAEEALREAQARTSAVLENIADTFYSLDDQWRFTMVNPAAEKAPLGKPASELLGKTIWDLYPALVNTPIYRHYLDAAKNRSMEHYEAKSPLNGRWYEVFMQGREGGVDVYMRDITVRKQAEDELRQRQAEIRALFDNIPAGLVLFSGTAPYTVLVHNRYYQELFAEPYRSRGMVGLNMHEYAPAVEASGVVAVFDEVVRTQQPRQFLDFAYNSNPPHESWFNWYLSPIILDGNVVALVSMSLDVTDRHRAELALRESEEKYRGLFDNVQESVAVYRLVYDETGEAVDRVFVDANPKAISEMGYQNREEVLGKPYSEVVLRHFPGDRESVDLHLRSLTEVAWSGKPLTYDTYFGDRAYITTQYPVNKNLVASSSIEITRRKRAEEALRDSEMQLRRAQELLDSITKSTGIMIAAEDTEFRYTYFNKAYADEIKKITGKDLALGMSMVDLFAGMPGEQENSVNQWKKVLGGKSIKQTISFENHGSEPRIFNVLHTPIRDDGGKVIGAGEVSYDVTRQIQIENELRKTSQYLENLINYANAPIIVWDPEFRITRFNRAFERLTGRTAQDVIGQTPDFLIPEKYRSRAMELIRGTTRGKRWEVVEIPILHKNGEIRTVLWNSAILTEENCKTIIATIAQGQDITDRKHAEEALQLLEARERAQLEELTKVLDAVPAAVWISHDPQGLHITGNRLSHEWLNLRDGVNMSKSAPPGERPETFRMFRDGRELPPEEMPVQRSSAGKEVRNFEFDFVYPCGEVRHVLGNATPLHDENGKPRGSVSAFIDITDRRQAEETVLSEKKKAEETLSLLNATLESTADGIFVVNTARKITSFNQNFISVWNIRDTSLLDGDDQGVLEFLQQQVKDPETFLERIFDLYRYPERERFDMVELNDGRIFERHSKPQKLKDEIIGRVWSYRDVTDRRRAEEKLLQSLQEKETLIREIHHRVKNNLQIISGLLDMTRMRTPDGTTTGILTDMMMKIKTMAQIHTRLYESKQFDKINMGSQIRDQVTDLSMIYGRSGTEILSEIDVQDVYLPVDQAIPCALVVNEILSNAFKHAFRGRKQGNIRVSVVREADFVRIIVKDNGIGIPKDVDVNRTTSLGLKLIRSLVLQLNGSVNIESNHGTEVTVECPLQPGGN